MGTSHLFSYNLFSNGVITGCTQFGDMAVSLNTTDTPGFTVSNMGNPYHGPDEDLGYVIAKASPARGRTHKRGTELAPDAVSFVRSTSKTDASFVDLVNKNFNQSFSLDSSGASTAKSYLTTNEYWTSYSIYELLGSLVFNGTNQSLSISPGITFGSGAFTVEGWFYNTSNFNNKGVMGSPVTSPVGCLNLHFSSNTTLISDKNGGGGSKTYTMSSAITTGAWHYLIYNRNSNGTTAVYIDGTRAGSTQSDTLNYNTSTDTIGRDYAGYWPGYWTNMRVTVGTAVYDSNSTTQTNPLQQLTSLANTKYLMLGSSVTTDTSGTQTITNNNTVTQSSALKPF